MENRAELRLRSASPGKSAKRWLSSKSYARYAKFMHDGSRGVTFLSDTKRQSSFDCRWVTSDILAGKKDTEWIPLLPEHGFLLFNGPNSEAADKILYYTTETSAPIVLPMRASDIPIHAVRYFAYKRAYFLSSLGMPRDRLENEFKLRPCLVVLSRRCPYRGSLHTQRRNRRQFSDLLAIPRRHVARSNNPPHAAR